MTQKRGLKGRNEARLPLKMMFEQYGNLKRTISFILLPYEATNF